MVPFSIFFQLLEICALHWEYCSALALAQDVYQNAVYTAITVRIRAFDCTLVGEHVCSREGVLGSNPTTPKFGPKAFAARWRILRNDPIEGTPFTVHYTVFRWYLQCDSGHVCHPVCLLYKKGRVTKLDAMGLQTRQETNNNNNNKTQNQMNDATFIYRSESCTARRHQPPRTESHMGRSGESESIGRAPWRPASSGVCFPFVCLFVCIYSVKALSLLCIL